MYSTGWCRVLVVYTVYTWGGDQGPDPVQLTVVQAWSQVATGQAGMRGATLVCTSMHSAAILRISHAMMMETHLDISYLYRFFVHLSLC